MDTLASILIVDDNPNNIRLLSHMLTEQHYQVRAVVSGERALASIHSTPPDLILLDIMMPGMDGYTLCERLKADPRTQDIPIIFISALDDTEGKIRAFDIGGVDYITKPFQIAEVLARVQTHLRIRRLSADLQAANAELGQRLLELDRVNEKLQQRNEELAAYDRSVSHDLKNPISFILISSEWLADVRQDLPQEQTDSILRNIAKHAQRAANIIESLLLLAQPERIQLTAIDSEAVVHTVLDGLRPLIEEHQAEVALPKAWPRALGHVALLERVWENYLTNGIKFGGRPPLLEIGADALAEGFVRFSVRDNGPGITPQDQDRLFREFHRLADGSVAGHGLGLSIARRIVNKMGGEVGVESAPGEGATFFFTLPAEP